MHTNERSRSLHDLAARPHHRLRVHTLALQLVLMLRPLMSRIRKHDRELHEQLRDAASSTVLNLGEAEHSDPGNRRARIDTASGSAGEARDALELVWAWAYIPEAELAPVLDHADHLVASLYKLRQR